MPSLTSCYFCGDAVGASLDEYDLPEDAAPDDQVTVTLCAGCRGKLTALFEEIDPAGSAVDSATDESSAADLAADADDVGVEPAIDEDPDLDPVAGDQEPIFADDGDAVLDEELPEESDTERPFATADDEAGPANASSPQEQEAAAEPSSSGGSEDDAGETGPDDPEPGDEHPAGAESTPDAEEDSGDSTDTAGADSTDTADTDPTATADADPADAVDADSAATDGSDADTSDSPNAPDRDTAAVEVDVGGTGSTSSGASAASSESSRDGPLANVSPRTYNRVVRLLQNREFPVDRADFEALATSAYELDHGECAAALDGAIEKGLLEERNGQLHRPE